MNAPALPLYPYQQRWFKDRSRFKLGRFARQTGKTFTTTLEIVDDTFLAEAERRRSPWVILSRGERQAKEAMEEGILRHLERHFGVHAPHLCLGNQAARYGTLVGDNNGQKSHFIDARNGAGGVVNEHDFGGVAAIAHLVVDRAVAIKKYGAAREWSHGARC